MQYMNPPAGLPAHVEHRSFFSVLYGHVLGYTVCLPADYAESGRCYPVVYHLHGWRGSESSEFMKMEKVCARKTAITVFPNNSPSIEDREDLPVEAMLMQELIPHIERTYRAVATREGRSISGFSMGGGMAFWYAFRHPELFSAVTAYAGTFHHYYHRDCPTVGVSPERAAELYRAMLDEARCTEETVIGLLCRNADRIRGRLEISLHIGTEDVLSCDSAILHLHLAALQIPHEYRQFAGAAHALGDIL